MIKAAYAFLLALFFAGCFQQIAVNSLGGIMDNGFEVLNEEQDLALAEQSIPSNLKLVETILRSDPDNEHYLLLAARGYASYALGFVEDQDPQRARLLYTRGKDYGLRILARRQALREALHGGVEEFSDALAGLSHDDVPAVFWTATAWGSMINTSLTDPDAIADLPKVEAMMRFVLERDSTYFYGGAHFFLGAIDGSKPKMLGGNLDASRDHFERCLAISHRKFLLTYIYYARTYAVQAQDRQLFEACLAAVDSASIDILPEARLSNAIAKKKAQYLRGKTDDLF